MFDQGFSPLPHVWIQFFSRKPYHTSITSASRLSVLVSHAHHKLLGVAPGLQTTPRVAERETHQATPCGCTGAKKRWAYCREFVLRESRWRPNSYPVLNGLSAYSSWKHLGPAFLFERADDGFAQDQFGGGCCHPDDQGRHLCWG